MTLPSDERARPSHHANASGTLFKNPWPSAQPPTWGELASSKFPLAWAHAHLHSHPLARAVKVVQPDWGRGADGGKGKGKGKGREMVGTWLGHAAAFVEMPWMGEDAAGEPASLKLLFDPIFSQRAGPTQYTGPGRLTPSPCQVEDLPGCDAVFISHNQSVVSVRLSHRPRRLTRVDSRSYDHLDLATIQSIFKRFPTAHFFVPLGTPLRLPAYPQELR